VLAVVLDVGKNVWGTIMPKRAPNIMLTMMKIIHASIAIEMPPSQPVLKLAL
jgi:hypothetical protein